MFVFTFIHDETRLWLSNLDRACELWAAHPMAQLECQRDGVKLVTLTNYPELGMDAEAAKQLIADLASSSRANATLTRAHTHYGSLWMRSQAPSTA